MKKKLIKLCIPAILLAALLLFSLFAGILASFQTQKGLMAKKYNDQQNASQMDSVTGLALSAEVEQYRERVAQEAEVNGIPDYVDLLLAIMMQESGGKVEDVFQCSESMGKAPNSISTEESIVQGVYVFAKLLNKAGVESPQDIDHIKLALQAYNFGSGFIKYAMDMSGGWTQEATDAWARDMSLGKKRSGDKAKNLGEWNYGDQFYTAHVLRYYSPAAIAESGVVNYAKTLLGCPYKWGASGPNEFDCSGFVWYVFKQTGTYTGVRTTALGFKNLAVPVDGGDAQPGDLVFFTRRNGETKNTYHIGIYLGNGLMIHAPKPGDVVKISEVTAGANVVVSYGRLSD